MLNFKNKKKKLVVKDSQISDIIFHNVVKTMDEKKNFIVNNSN